VCRRLPGLLKNPSAKVDFSVVSESLPVKISGLMPAPGINPERRDNGI